MAERASELMLDNMITDRTIIDVMAFTRLAKSIPYFVADDFNDAVSHLLREYDYIFYVSPEGVELEDNGVRVVDAEYRKKIDEEIQQLITRHKSKFKNYAELSGTTEERIQKVKQVIGL
jgi:nicotinamide riboside kinase